MPHQHLLFAPMILLPNIWHSVMTKKLPINPYVLPMIKRHPGGGKHKNGPRGGQKNEQEEYLREYEDEKEFEDKNSKKGSIK